MWTSHNTMNEEQNGGMTKAKVLLVEGDTPTSKPNAKATLPPDFLIARGCVRAKQYHWREMHQPRSHFISETRCFNSKPNALAIFNKESTETVRCPFSNREMNTTDKPAFSANFSWLNLARLRWVRMASPKIRRCIGTEGTPNSNKRPYKATFTIVYIFLRLPESRIKRSEVRTIVMK
jgi:hypothetical protein